MIRRKSYRACLFLLLTAYSCIEPYDPSLSDHDVNYLVVDAFLDGSNGVATVRLSRSQPVKSDEPLPMVSGATVLIENEQSDSYPLDELNAGLYTGFIADISPVQHYRLVIRTGDEHTYASTFVPVIQAPPIDSISWSPQRDGIRFEVNTHDPSDQTRFFKWTFSETYEIHSRLPSLFMFSEPGIVVPRPPEMALSECWRTNESTGILVGSVKHLQQSVLSRYPVTLIPYGAQKLFVKYSLLVRQQGLTEEGYTYWHQLARSTENLGGLFDPLPSEVTGNIACTVHEDEHALGIFTASTVSEMRLFLRRSDLPVDLASQFYDRSYCPVDTLKMEDLHNYGTWTLLSNEVYDLAPFPIGYTTSHPGYIDCRYWGGDLTKPDFWDE